MLCYGERWSRRGKRMGVAWDVLRKTVGKCGLSRGNLYELA